jgi:hypothetical protein
MKNYLLSLTWVLPVILVISGCGSSSKQDTSSSARFLPEQMNHSDLKRITEIRIFSGDSLWEYIDGGAEVYHLYKFVDVATADYSNNKTELVADIYRFDSPLNAFGLYSMLCPPETEIINLGVEGFLSPASINFVKGEYLVRLTGFEDTEESRLALVSMAKKLNDGIPGISERPAQFKSFPIENKIGGTDKYYAEQFMGQRFLTEVFTRSIYLNLDTITLFMSADESGGKFLQWSTYADQISGKKARPAGIPFDDTLSFVFEDNYYGQIMAGLKNGKLLGQVNYKDTYIEYLTTWLNTFNTEEPAPDSL